MSTILQKIRHLNHYPIIQKCTVDDNIQVCTETLVKIAYITKEGPLASRYVAVTLFEKLTKKSSSLSAKIIPILIYTLRHGSVDFQQEVSYKKELITKLMECALKCQGTLVHGLYQELVELVEYEHRKPLLRDNNDPDYCQPKCPSGETKTRGEATCDIQIDEIISPEIRLVEQITAPSCIEIFPSMMDIWKFSVQYKELNQDLINSELLKVLQSTNTSAQLRALSVLDYLSQHFKGSSMSGFCERLEHLSKSENNDLSKPARKILNHMTQDSCVKDTNPTLLRPVSPHLKSQTQDNLISSHMKRSYDKILLTSPPTGYQSFSNTNRGYSEQKDEALLDLSSPCSSTSLNHTPPHRLSFLSTFFGSTPTLPQRSRRCSVNSTDNLLEDHTYTNSDNL